MSKVVVTPEDVAEAEQLEMSPETILKLIDLIFLGKENSKELPS